MHLGQYKARNNKCQLNIVPNITQSSYDDLGEVKPKQLCMILPKNQAGGDSSYLIIINKTVHILGSATYRELFL